MTRTRRGRSTGRRRTRPAPVAASTSVVDWTPAPHYVRVPGQRLEAPFARHVPHLERAVARPGHDVAVRQGGDAIDLPPSRRGEASTRGSTGRRRRAEFVCPLSVRRHSPVDLRHTLSVRSSDPDTMRPFDRTATHKTCAPRGVDEQSTRCSTGRRRRAQDVCPLSVWRVFLYSESE